MRKFIRLHYWPSSTPSPRHPQPDETWFAVDHITKVRRCEITMEDGTVILGSMINEYDVVNESPQKVLEMVTEAGQ